MPELPEVACFAKALKRVCKDTALEKLVIRKKSRYTKTPIANYDELVEQFPLQILNVYHRGKKIVFELEGSNYLVSSLGLEGKWIPDDIPHSDLYLKLSSSEESFRVYYNDTRHHGTLEIYTSKKEFKTRMAKIGPDFLNNQISEKQWLKVCRSTEAERTKDITDFLMDQSFFSGVGNYIKAEVLYRAKICPAAKIQDISDSRLKKLLAAIQDVIDRSYAAQGASLRTYYDYDGNKGEFETVIYGKSECPKGNDIIKTIFGDGRDTHWCPEIQINPEPWCGPGKISRKKLKKGQYTVLEMKQYCSYYKIKKEGKKAELIERLIDYLE